MIRADGKWTKGAAALLVCVLAACAASTERVRSLKDAQAEAASKETAKAPAAEAAKAPAAEAAKTDAAADKAKADAQAAAADKAKADAAAAEKAKAAAAVAPAAAAADPKAAALAADKAKADALAADKAKADALLADKAKEDATAAAAAAAAAALAKASIAGKLFVPATLVLPANTKAAVDIELRFRTGSIDDPQGKSGLTLLAARVMSEGGTVALDSKQLLEALFPIAADLDVRVDREQTGFIARVHRDAIDKLVPILLDVVLKPRWDEKEFNRIRESMVNDLEKRLREADEENLGKEGLAQLMYRGHPYGRPVLGLAADLKSATLAETKAHALRVFTADRLTIGVAGGSPAGLAERLSKELTALPSTGAPAVTVPRLSTKASHPRFLLIEKAGPATAVSMGFPHDLSRKDPDWAAMSVGRSAMGEHRQFNGRLMNRLREARGLNYGDYAYIEHFQQEGGDAATAQTGRVRSQQDFTVWLRPVKNDNRLFAVRAALYELTRVRKDELISSAELARTKGFLDGYILLFDQTDGRKLGFALDDAFSGTPDFLKGWRKSLDAVTVEQVNAAWTKRIDPANLQIVMVGPDMKALKAQILANGPSPYAGNSKEASDAEVAKFPLGAANDADVEIVPVEKMFE